MARTNLQIKVGTYTGDGTTGRIFSSLGFKPDYLLIKGGTNIAVCRMKWVRGDATLYAGSNLAAFTGGILDLNTLGFTLGSNATVNANGTVYYYVAIGGSAAQRYMQSGSYLGTGVARDITTSGIKFTPDLLIAKTSGSGAPMFKTSSHPTNDSSFMDSTGAAVTSGITGLISNGFQLGINAAINTNNALHYYLAMKKLGGVFTTGSYTGDGTDNRNITGLGFQPSVVFVKRPASVHTRFRTSDVAGDATLHFGGVTTSSDEIQSLTSDGFQVGVALNANASVYQWFALKAGLFNVPLGRTTV